MKVRNFLLALLLSLTLTVGVAVIYVFHPLIFFLLRSAFSNEGTSGFVFVGGDVLAKLFWALLVVEPLLFLLIYSFLERKSATR